MNNAGKSELCDPHPTESMLMQNEITQDGLGGHHYVLIMTVNLSLTPAVCDRHQTECLTHLWLKIVTCKQVRLSSFCRGQKQHSQNLNSFSLTPRLLLFPLYHIAFFFDLFIKPNWIKSASRHSREQFSLETN